jgi:HEPN domain-containing protein
MYSWDYEHTAPADEWFRMAHAFVEASDRLFTDMKDGRIAGTFHHGKAAAFLFDQSLEHFLKASLIVAGDGITRSHDLGSLYSRFRKRFPGKAFAWTGRIAEMAKSFPTQPANEFLRYPTDSSGVEWKGNTHCDLDVWCVQVKAFGEDFSRLEPRIRARYP